MNGSIKRPRDDPHRLTQSLLPGFVTGRLDTAERLMVEAHLSDCAACRADERLERRLEAELSAMPFGVDAGWTRGRLRLLDPAPRRPKAGILARLSSRWRAAMAEAPGAPGRKGWAIAVQAVAMLIVLGASLFLVRPAAKLEPRDPARDPAALPSAEGNLLVTFRPDITERVLRGVLADDGAQIVDGPSADGAYAIKVPATRRAVVLADLRHRAEVGQVRTMDPVATP